MISLNDIAPKIYGKSIGEAERQRMFNKKSIFHNPFTNIDIVTFSLHLPTPFSLPPSLSLGFDPNTARSPHELTLELHSMPIRIWERIKSPCFQRDTHMMAISINRV